MHGSRVRRVATIIATAAFLSCERRHSKPPHGSFRRTLVYVTKQSTLRSSDKRATLGHPSQIWTRGLERRLEIMRRYVDLENKRILDIGCGVGAFVRRLREFSPGVAGIDVDRERVTEGGKALPGLALAVGERLPFADGSFDVVLLHEVLEHVTDDQATLREAYRVLRPSGRVVIFCPNRLYPFET
ncbi:MAG: class I SAM-dependent methyltransferase, partial [Chloroflexi bacterium]